MTLGERCDQIMRLIDEILGDSDDERAMPATGFTHPVDLRTDPPDV